MATVENRLAEVSPLEKKSAPGGLRFDWIVTFLCAALIGGVWLDNWAHNHGKVDNTFFTPWHAVLYSAFVVVAIFLVLTLIRNHSKGYAWQEALPTGYGASFLGVLIFAIGGVLDMIWHILFGVEVSVEALLSPTHLMLAFGLILIVSGPLRAAWLRLPEQQKHSLLRLLPAVFALIFILATFGAFTQYAHPQVTTWAAGDIHAAADLPVDLYVMNGDGSLQTRLLSNSGSVSVPSWSHDGHKIVFASDTTGNLQIYSMNADGSNLRRLTHTTTDEWAPTWSPDGSKIAFSSGRNNKSAIYVMNADGSNQQLLTDNAAWKPSWSPDGSKIVFVSGRDGVTQIYVMNADGSNQIRLTHTNSDERWPVWSPDGSKIAFSSSRDGSNSEIFVMNADGAGQMRLTNQDSWSGNAVWSPDGKKIAFTSDRDHNDEVYVMNADGSHQVNLSNDPGAEDGSSGIAWSTANKILYTVQPHAAVNPFLSQDLGLASILLQTTILMGIVLLLLRHWLLPFGTLTLMFTINSALISVLTDQYPFVLSALGAGLLADLLIWWLKPTRTRPVAFRVTAFLIPFVFYGLYFVVLSLTKGISWSIHLWMGSIVLAGIIGLLMSYLLIPPLATASPPLVESE